MLYYRPQVFYYRQHYSFIVLHIVDCRVFHYDRLVPHVSYSHHFHDNKQWNNTFSSVKREGGKSWAWNEEYVGMVYYVNTTVH